MSRPPYAPLCASCRSFILSRLPQPQQPVSRTASTLRIRRFSTIHPTRASLNEPPSTTTTDSPPTQETNTALREALHEYMRLQDQSTGVPFVPGSTPAALGKRDRVLGQPPKTAQIFVNDDPTSEFVTTKLVPLTVAIQKGELSNAWTEYQKLAKDPAFNSPVNPIILNLFRGGIHTDLFDLVMENEGEDPDIPVPIKLANDWAEMGVASPTMYSRILVDALKQGEISLIELILKHACKMSPPYQLELAYLRGQVMDVYEDSQMGADTATIEKSQIELWCLIYAAYNYVRSLSIPGKTSGDISEGEWPKQGTFFHELHNTLPQVKNLPTDAMLRDVLTSYGFNVGFIDKVVLSAANLETANFFTQLKALREDIKYAVSRRDYPQLKSLYEDGLRMQLPFKGHYYNLFILAFAGLNHIEAATAVWNDMLGAGYPPTAHSWNALLMGCGRARDTKFLLLLWKKMLDTGVVPDTFLWTTRTHALFIAGNIREGVASLREMAQSDNTRPNLNTINAALAGLMRNAYSKEARSILEYAVKALGIKPDLVTYNTLLKGHMSLGDIQEALKILGTMEENEIRPDVVTCTIILNGLYKHSLQNITPTTANPAMVAAGTTSLGGVESENALQANANQTTLFSICSRLLQQMRQSGITANVNFYTILIDGLLHPSSGNILAARDILRIMQNRGIEGTAATYTVFVRYYASVGDIDGIESCWRDMAKRRVYPDWIILEETVKGYARMRPPAGLGEVKGVMNPRQARGREWELTNWREGVCNRILWWVGKVDALNKGLPFQDVLRQEGGPWERGGPPQQFQQQRISLKNNQNIPENNDTHDSMAASDIIPPANAHFRLTMKTYKEVLGRFLSEERYDAVEHVLRLLEQKCVREGVMMSGGENWKQLDAVLKVAGASGIRVPEKLVERLFA
ncbi:hypothetical protein L211DRAFT_838927 [Terfezia boudieri ATCC MYA-4762]|uniref:Pentacotripeptide-repeat region of PRORP domain-containing protein n=1 Tax=Terfezia boudieri ATCC MYA-4762 TaxID=1051890 RepID=A0A3N4LNW4_9PEZI|nr:hypothetical protein L211DRAFT_838927 [Terfezia boudieri ATCC MYA-4762]